MNLATFLRAAKQYNNLGWAIQGQLHAVCDGDSMADQNSNALRIIVKFLRYIENDVKDSEEMGDDIEQFLDENLRNIKN